FVSCQTGASVRTHCVGGQQFKFTEAVSFVINCDTQRRSIITGRGHGWQQESDTDDEARSLKIREGICRKMTTTCLRFMFLLCKTFQACAVATTKSGV